MVFWITMLGIGLAGGLLVLHGFAKSKGTSEQMLGAYQGILNEPKKKPPAAKKED